MRKATLIWCNNLLVFKKGGRVISKRLFLAPILLLLICQLNAQVDTCIIQDTVVYQVQNQQDGAVLYWSVSGGEIISENPSQTDSVLVEWTSLGEGLISVYEQNEFNCNGETSKIEVLVIEKNPLISFDIPNAFSPNRDNVNECFKIDCSFEPENFSITIYNRWGADVFEADDINFCWNGKIKDKLCKPGIYYYIIEYLDNATINTKKGFVHLFK